MCHLTWPLVLYWYSMTYGIGGDTPDIIPEKIDIAWIDPGYVPAQFAHSIASAAADMQYHECLGHVYRFGTSLPALGRNVIIRDGYLKNDSPWLWFVDSDMVFDKGHVMKLYETAKDMDAQIVSGLAFVFKDANMPIPSYFLEGDGKFYEKDVLHMMNRVPDKPIEIAAAGFASVLIHRDVFEALQPPRHEAYRWFDQIMMPPNPTLSGEDTQFYVRAREAGFKAVLDPNAETWHLKTVGIGKADFFRHWELREELGILKEIREEE